MAWTRGIGTAAVGVVLTAGMLGGAGWLLASWLGARSEIRAVASLVAPPDRTAWAGPDAGVSPAAMVARLWPAAERRPFATAMRDPIGGLAAIIPVKAGAPDDASADVAVTGSVGPRTFKLASLESTPASLPARSPALGAAAPPKALPVPNALPLANALPASNAVPKTRPKLASLGPAPDLAIRPPEDAGMRKTAVYDITARTVYLPGGERLEAHSGLGDLMDDPRHVRRKMRGATPPNIYNLRLRESLFHGVRAIRMTPVNEDAMFNRDGILAHSYMLGPSGQSNGCVSFRDYPKFLRAFLRGEVDRIVVVARLDRPPVYARRPDVKSASSEY